jgi:hypothetical protein
MDTELKVKPKLQILRKIEEIKVPPGELGAVLELLVRNKNGEITQRQEMLSKSFVKQFLQIFWMQCSWPSSGYGMLPRLVKGTDGTEYYLGAYTYTWRCDAPANNDTYGVMVGTGITAPTIDDYQMETKIAHGIGAGQMQYSAVSFGAPASDGTTSQFTITRDFANQSGGSITVREVGLIVTGYQYETGTTRYFLTIRDAVNIAVPNGETLTVNYRIQATV